MSADDKVSHLVHEIRTPLNAIRTLTHLMMTSKTSKISEDDMGIMQAIMQATEMAIAVTEPSAGVASLHDIVSEIFAVLTPIAKEKRVNILSKRSDMEAMRTIRVNSLIKHAISNILRNGIKFTNADGKVYLVYSKGIISIYDNGPGIPVDQRGKLFTFGERLGAVQEGKGIGLALCKQMMKKIGGDITLRPGVQTIFDISFTALPN